jgi:hypothetical protein
MSDELTENEGETKQYRVTLTVMNYVDVEVDAESPEEAETKAHNQAMEEVAVGLEVQVNEVQEI